MRVTLPALSWCASPEQDPRAPGPPAPLTPYPTPCTESDTLLPRRPTTASRMCRPWGEEKRGSTLPGPERRQEACLGVPERGWRGWAVVEEVSCPTLTHGPGSGFREDLVCGGRALLCRPRLPGEDLGCGPAVPLGLLPARAAFQGFHSGVHVKGRMCNAMMLQKS